MAGSWSLDPMLHTSILLFLNMEQRRKAVLGDAMYDFFFLSPFLPSSLLPSLPSFLPPPISISLLFIFSTTVF